MYMKFVTRLCEKTDEGFHFKTCISRDCIDCGVSKFSTDPFETSISSYSPDVNQKCFEYLDIKTKSGLKKKIDASSEKKQTRRNDGLFFKATS